MLLTGLMPCMLQSMLLTTLNQEASEQCSQHPAPSPENWRVPSRAASLPSALGTPRSCICLFLHRQHSDTALLSILPGSEERCQEGFSTLEGTVLCSLRLRSCEQTRPKKSVKFKLGLDYEPQEILKQDALQESTDSLTVTQLCAPCCPCR